jgi:hypothetical protein
MKLNDKQKQFLVDNDYITTKVLDSLTHKGWERYFIENFEWKLDLHLNNWGMNDLVLIDRENDITYDIMLNFQGNDLQELLLIK